MHPAAPRVVVVDDDANLVSVVAMIARETFPEETGVRIETHVTVEAARTCIDRLAGERQQRIVVLSDYHLPPSSSTGLDLLAEVRDRLPAAKRVLMTGRERSELEPEVTRAELDGFLPKPFTFLELQPLLERLVGDGSSRRLAIDADAEGLARTPNQPPPR